MTHRLLEFIMLHSAEQIHIRVSECSRVVTCKCTTPLLPPSTAAASEVVTLWVNFEMSHVRVENLGGGAGFLCVSLYLLCVCAVGTL